MQNIKEKNEAANDEERQEPLCTKSQYKKTKRKYNTTNKNKTVQ